MKYEITMHGDHALVEARPSGRTAVCRPTFTETSLHFDLIGWFDDYEDALLVVQAVSVVKDLNLDESGPPAIEGSPQ